MDEQNGDFWSKRAALIEQDVRDGWLDWDYVELNHIRPQISGDKSVYFPQYFFEKYFGTTRPAKCLSLGCGGGKFERYLIAMNWGEHYDAYDASEGSIALAREQAEKEGLAGKIQFFVSDLNVVQLQRREYDVAVAKMSLHHLDDLEHVFQEISQSLKPGGLLMMNEYIGPNRFQWTDRQLEICHEILQLLPDKYRWSVHFNKTIFSVPRPTIEEMMQLDPTEAIRSVEIIPILGRHFDIIERKDYGGTILQLLFSHIMKNFDMSAEDQAAIVNLICWIERCLLKYEVISSDFAFIVAKPKQSC